MRAKHRLYIFLIGLALSVVTHDARAQGLTLTYDQEDIVTAWIWAQRLEASCPRWKLNESLRDTAFASAGLKEADLAPRAKFGERIALYRQRADWQLSQVSKDKLCDVPKELYGPSGSWAANWMIAR